MSIQLYMDEDAMDQVLVEALRARNVNVVTALDAGMIEREDREHLDYATEHGRVLCTFNVRDFYRLHSEYLSQGKPFDRLRTGRTLVSSLCASSTTLWASKCATCSD